MAARLTSEDFLTGLFAALALRNWKTISIRGDRFDKASAAAFADLEGRAPELGLELRFYVTPHPTYGDSTVIRDAVAKLAQWDLVSLDNPEYLDIRLKISPSYADTLFSQLGLDQALFTTLADTFASAYADRQPG